MFTRLLMFTTDLTYIIGYFAWEAIQKTGLGQYYNIIMWNGCVV